MSLTAEQQAPIDYALNPTDEKLVLVNAIAGSGKTHMLVELVKQVPHKKAMYLAYNKAIATEAEGKFPSSVTCMTLHSLAYRNVVKPLGMRVGYFGYRSVKEKLPFALKLAIGEAIREFSLSEHTSWEAFEEEYDYGSVVVSAAKGYFQQMVEGKIECTHDVYMKVFHLLLHKGSIEFPEQDIILIDEAGDLAAVTVAIFQLLPAKLRVAVGDTHQNIYGFNNTVNAFEVLKNEGKLFNLTQSFRVADKIAQRIQAFCNRHVDPNMVFHGITPTDHEIVTQAYLSRTNSALMDIMAELGKQNIPYKLVRKASEVFRLHLDLCGLKYQGDMSNPEYRDIQKDFDEWHEDQHLRTIYKNPLTYLAAEHSHDVRLVSAIRFILSRGKAAVFNIYNQAKANETIHSNIYLGTAHTTKGLEFDRVTICDDLNMVVSGVLAEQAEAELEAGESVPFTEEQLQELNLYYVACSRAKKELSGAQHL